MPNNLLPAKLFITNRQRLTQLLPPRSVAVVNANDILPVNADGSLPMITNSDLFYLCGVEQEQSILLLNPDAEDEKHREILFLREPSPENELWEGHKLTRDEARALTGIQTIFWLAEFPRMFHRLVCASEHVYLNSNEHNRAVVEVESRDARFIAALRRQYPLHDFRRLAPLLHQLRPVKSPEEIALIQKACDVTDAAFQRVAKFTKPGVRESDVEAEYAHEFIRNGCRFAYTPIVGSGLNACCLHYTANSAVCRAGELLLLDVGAAYKNYNADLTRTIPVSGRFSRRQKQVYNAVLRIFRAQVAACRPGKTMKDLRLECEEHTAKECVDLGLLKMSDLKKQSPDTPAVKRYFMHGVSHSIGLDVHDVMNTGAQIEPGWVLTVEPAIYLKEENFGVRLENTVVVTKNGPADLMAGIPIEVDEIEALMNRH